MMIGRFDDWQRKMPGIPGSKMNSTQTGPPALEASAMREFYCVINAGIGRRDSYHKASSTRFQSPSLS